MRNAIAGILMALTVAVLLPACGSKEKEGAAPVEPETTEEAAPMAEPPGQRSDVVQEFNQARRQLMDELGDVQKALGKMASAGTEAAREELQERMDQLDERLEEMRKQMKELEGDAKEQMQSTMEQLEKQRDNARKQWQALKEGNEERFESLRQDLGLALRSLGQTIEKTGAQLETGDGEGEAAAE